MSLLLVLPSAAPALEVVRVVVDWWCWPAATTAFD